MIVRWCGCDSWVEVEKLKAAKRHKVDIQFALMSLKYCHIGHIPPFHPLHPTTTDLALH